VVMLVNIYVLEDNAKNLGRELEKLIVEGRWWVLFWQLLSLFEILHYLKVKIVMKKKDI
jgi:hypothetical protein